MTSVSKSSILKAKSILREAFTVRTYGNDKPYFSSKLLGHNIQILRNGEFFYISNSGDINTKASKRIIKAIEILNLSTLITFNLFEVSQDTKRIYINSNFEGFVNCIKSKLDFGVNLPNRKVNMFNKGRLIEKLIEMTPQYILRNLMNALVETTNLKNRPVENFYTFYSIDYKPKVKSDNILINLLCENEDERSILQPTWYFMVSFDCSKLHIKPFKEVRRNTSITDIDLGMFLFLNFCRYNYSEGENIFLIPKSRRNREIKTLLNMAKELKGFEYHLIAENFVFDMNNTKFLEFTASFFEAIRHNSYVEIN